MRRKYLYPFVACIFLSGYSSAQVLTVGTAGMSVQPGTILSADSLVLVPSSILTLTSASLSQSSAPVTAGGGSSIDKVFTFSTPVHYNGTIGMSYADAELNGNAAPALVLAYNSSPSGAYTLNCGSVADAADHKVTSAALAGVNLSSITAVSATVSVANITGAGSVCAGGTLALSDVTTGGSWSSGSPAIAMVSGTGVVTGISAGTTHITYTVSNGCNTAIATAVVTVNGVINITPTIDNATCYGLPDGYIAANASGGTAPYTYDWSGAGISFFNAVYFAPAGVYAVTATDAHGCSVTAAYTVTQPAPLSLSATVTNVSCHGSGNGSINTTVTGGIPAYSYLWSNGSHAADPGSLLPGTYGVIVTDAHLCITTGSYTVTQPSALSLSATTANASCHGSSNGSINTMVGGGTSPYTYHWSNGATAADPAGLAAGTYSVTVTDAHGCTVTGAYTITQPAAISLSATTSSVTCNGGSNGSINTTVSSGIPGYTYVWSNGSHLADPAGLAAATYSVTVSDAHGCTSAGTYTVTQPSAINITATVKNVSCNGDKNGSIATTASGGTPGYSYTWSTGAHTASLSGLASGTATLTVTDVHGCTSVHTYTITQPAMLNLTAAVTNASCAGCSNGSINTTVTGGAPAYSYLWSNSSHLADPTGLAAGTFSVTATDANGCTVKGSWTVTQPGNGRGSRTTNGAGDTTTGITITGPVMGEVSVLPNPNKGTFTIKGTLGVTSDVEVSLEITDMLGQVVYRNKVIAQNGELNEHIQLNPSAGLRTTVANGMYILSLSSGDQHKAFHIVVEQ